MASKEKIVFIVMGVSGVGKTTISRTLADRIGARYLEADDYHPDENRLAMQKGIPLSDAMRLPWLERLATAGERQRQDGAAVIACSALKRSYRDLLRSKIGKLQFIYLHGSRELIAERLMARTDHFMPPSMLTSQLSILEPPAADEDAIFIDVSPPKDALNDIVEQSVRTKLTKLKVN